jgi:hypothetical protein
MVLQFRNSQRSPSSTENMALDRNLNRRSSTLTPKTSDGILYRYLHRRKLDLKMRSELSLIGTLYLPMSSICEYGTQIAVSVQVGY